MALTVDTPLQHVTGDYEDFPVAASTKIYEGAIVGGSSGYARGLVAGDPFLGHCTDQADNSSGAAGAKNVRCLTGRYRLQVTLSGVAITDIGQAVYGSADDTYTLTQGSNTRVGVVVRYVAANTAIVEFQTAETTAELGDLAMGEGSDIALGTTTGTKLGTGATQKLGFWGATAVVQQAHVADPASAAAMTQDTLTDNGGGTADLTVDSMAAPTTLTDNTGLSASHNDTLEAVTTFTPSVGWNGSSVYPSAADATAIGAAITALNQNASDTAQKIIEIVTLLGTLQNNFKEVTAQLAKIKTDVAAVRTGSEANNTAIDSVLAELATTGLQAAA